MAEKKKANKKRPAALRGGDVSKARKHVAAKATTSAKTVAAGAGGGDRATVPMGGTNAPKGGTRARK